MKSRDRTIVDQIRTLPSKASGLMKYLPRFALPVLLVSTSLLLASCTDLTTAPSDEVTEANFEPTERDVANLVAPVYTELRYWFNWQGYMDLQEEPADTYVTPVRPNGWYDGGTYVRMHKHTWTPEAYQHTNLWNTAFGGINNANRVLNQIETGTLPVEGQVKTDLVAELRGMRAFYYYLLLDNFGNVPIVTDFTREEPPPQASREEVYNFVVSEFQEVIPELSERADQSTYGRLNKWAAKTVLADTYLNAEVYIGESQYDKVINQTNDIIEAGRYQLEDNYLDNFTRNNQNSEENIFVVPYDEVNAQGNGWHMKYLKPVNQETHNLQAQPWGGSASQPQFIDTYDEDDERLEDTWMRGPQKNDQGETLITYVKNIPGINTEETGFGNGYPISKYEIYEGMTSNSDVDAVIYRYAHVLMMKAEALLRTGNASQAADLVTQVRERSFDDTNPSKAEVTGAELQQGSTYEYGIWDGQNQEVVERQGGEDIQYGRFLDELGWEFAVEAHRRQDLIRFGVFTTKKWFNHRPNGEHTKLFPIPQSELESNSKLEQNPGY